jgi:hypothetical protein
MVGNSAASRLAHLHPELALLHGVGFDQCLLISALSATRWEAASCKPASAPRISPWSTALRRSGSRGLAVASPRDLHTVPTRPACHCSVVPGRDFGLEARAAHQPHRGEDWPWQETGVAWLDGTTGARSRCRTAISALSAPGAGSAIGAAFSPGHRASGAGATRRRALTECSRALDLASRRGITGRYRQRVVQGRAQHAYRHVRQGTPGHADQGQCRQPRLHRHRLQRSPRFRSAAGEPSRAFTSPPCRTTARAEPAV